MRVLRSRARGGKEAPARYSARGGERQSEAGLVVQRAGDRAHREDGGEWGCRTWRSECCAVSERRSVGFPSVLSTSNEETDYGKRPSDITQVR